MATVRTTKATIRPPKISVPKPRTPKAMSMNMKAPKTSMSSYGSASKAQTGLKGAISKGQLSQLNTADENQSY